MSWIDRWPSTPAKQFSGWTMAGSFFITSMIFLWLDKKIQMELWYGVAAFVFGYNGDGTLQFWSKRKTSWEPPNKAASGGESESGSPPPSPEPVVPMGDAVLITQPSAPALRDVQRKEGKHTTPLKADD